MNKKTNTTHKNNNIKTPNNHIDSVKNKSIKSIKGAKNSKNVKNTKKIINWSEYNKALVSRGDVSIYVSEAIDQKVFPKPEKSHKVGHPTVYPDGLVLFILTIRELFRLPLRQSIGFCTYLLETAGLNWQLPDYSTLSRRMGGLNPEFCRKIREENVIVLVDSSGFKVFGEGEWKVRKHGIGYRRTWRETHIAISHTTRNIIGLINTKSGTHDNTQFIPLLEQAQAKHQIKTVIGDGAYDAKDNYLIAKKLGLEFIAPPPKNASEHLNMYHYHPYDTPGWEDRNAVVRHIEQFGMDGWKADVDYHRRSLVENTFYRLKTIFGGNLKSRKEETQYTEQCIRASLLNRFNEIGLPRYAN